MRLGLAILRRLDRLAETGLSLHTNPAPGAKRSAPAVVPRALSFDWGMAVDALRACDDEAVGRAPALAEGNKVEEVDDPSIRPPSTGPDQPRFLDLSDRCWWEDDEECWLTNFPPPAGFTGYESRAYDGIGDVEPYVRACTEREAAILAADVAAERAAERVEDEQLRAAWFEYLAQEGSEGVFGADDAQRPTEISESALPRCFGSAAGGDLAAEPGTRAPPLKSVAGPRGELAQPLLRNLPDDAGMMPDDGKGAG